MVQAAPQMFQCSSESATRPNDGVVLLLAFGAAAIVFVAWPYL
jgi:hypothetical protein